MGADQNLIRAASRMGEKPWDYSGIMKAISAIGVYTAKKRAVANELTSYGSAITNIKGIPDEIFNGDYGAQNMDFMTSAKQQWSNATDIIKNPLNLPSSKKYKTAVQTINNIKSVLETNKASLLKWEEIRKGINDKRSKMSKGTTFDVENRILNIVNNEADANINNNLIFTNQGLMFFDSELNELVDIKEITNGYKENFMGDEAKKVDQIVNKYGRLSYQGGEPTFLKNEATAEFKRLFNGLKSQSFDHLRSLAYDYQINGDASFVEDNSEKLLKLTNKDWYDQNPNATDEEILVMKEQTLASVFGANNQQTLEGQMLEWFIKKTEENFNNSKPKLTKAGNIQVSLMNVNNSSMVMDPQEKITAIDQIKKKGSWSIDGTQFTWDEKAGQWKYQEYGETELQPIPNDPQEKFEVGSSEALLYRFNYDEGIKRALAEAGLLKEPLSPEELRKLVELKEAENSQVQSDTSQVQNDTSFVPLTTKSDTILK